MLDLQQSVKRFDFANDGAGNLYVRDAHGGISITRDIGSLVSKEPGFLWGLFKDDVTHSVTANGLVAGNDLTQYAPSLKGGAGADTLKAQAGGDWLFGLDGNDHLIGGKGNDVLVGGAGNDLMEAGGGSRYVPVQRRVWPGSGGGLSGQRQVGVSRGSRGDAER